MTNMVEGADPKSFLCFYFFYGTRQHLDKHATRFSICMRGLIEYCRVKGATHP